MDSDKCLYDISIGMEIFKLCKEKWYNEKKNILKDLFYNKLQNKELKVISYLLKKFLYQTYDEAESSFFSLFPNFINIIKPLENPKIIFTGINDNSAKVKSHHGLLCKIKYHMQRKYNIDCKVCLSIKELIKYISLSKPYDVIVFLDDFIGTGTTTLKIFEELVNSHQIDKNNLFIITEIIMKEAYERINREISPKKIIYDIMLTKGISDSSDIDNYTKNSYKQDLEQISKSNYLDTDLCLGWGRSESLYSGINTPNNTFGIFWQKNGDNTFPRIFPRICD